MKKNITVLLLLVSLLSSLGVSAQDKVIRGVVSDAKETLIGATIALYNKDNRSIYGVTTDINGEYSIKIPDGQVVSRVVFSFIGYKTRSIDYKGQTVLNVKLEEDVLSLDVVDVTAKAIDRDDMGMDKKALGGAREKINLDELQDMVVTSVGDMLQGKLANVDLVASSGAPGAKMSIRIRGTASLNASNEPLIVIDGVPQDINVNEDFDFSDADEEDFGSLLSIAPSDIGSIEVLKDASATAVWGAKAANGVLIVTTIKGKKSKPTFSITEKLSTSIEPKKVPLLNAKEYVTLMQDALWNRVRDNGYKDMNILTQYQDIRYNPNYKYFREFSQDVDWLDLLVQTPLNSETNFNMSGGGDKANYRFSMGYLSEKGTTIGENFKRVTSRLSLEYKFSDRFRVNSSFSYTEGNRNSSHSGPRGIARQKMPNLTPYVLDADGNFTDEYFTQPKESIQGSMYNPVALVYDAQNNYVNRNASINFNMHYQIMTSLKFDATVAFSLSKSKSRTLLPVSATGASMESDNYNRSEDSKSDGSSLWLNTGLLYSKRFGEIHNINVSGRFQAQDNAGSSFGVKSYGNASLNLSDPSNNGILASIGASSSENRSVAFIGSFFYSLKDRYNFNVLFRTDGTSRTGRSSRWGTFPSLNATWYVHKENFIKNIEWISEIIPRVAWGRSGTAPSGNATYAGTYEALTNNYVDLTAVKPSSIQMNNLKWETTTQYNVGLDLGFKGDAIHINGNYYVKTTSDLLQQNMAIQSTTGYTSIPWFNDGKMQNKGWEASVRLRNIVKIGTFRVNVDFNMSRNRNKVLDLPSTLDGNEPSVSNGSYTNKVIKGRPLGSFFGYRFMGIYQNLDDTYARDREGNVIKDGEGNNVFTKIKGTFRQRPGDSKYYDVNFDGIIDKYDVVYLGNSQPLIMGGGSVTFFYKNLSLRTSLQYRIGQSVINRTLLNAESMSSAKNQARSVLKRWRYEGDDTDIPRALWGENYNTLGSDKYVEKASFMKIKDITINYSFSKRFLNKLHARNMRMYLTCYDPFTITKYKGQDPEVGIPSSWRSFAEDGSLSPRARRFAFGLTVDF